MGLPINLQVTNFQRCKYAPVCQPLYSTIVLSKVLYCKIQNVLSFVLFLIYYLCEKYYKPTTVQYYIVNCVSWVPTLTLLELQTIWTYKHALRMEFVRMYVTQYYVIFMPFCV